MRPNFFVALKLTNSQFVEMVKTIQGGILIRDPAISSCFTSPLKLHLTFFVLHLHNVEEINLASSTLDSCKFEINSILTENISVDPFLEVGKFGSFGNRVLFISLNSTPMEKKIGSVVEILVEKFKQSGLLESSYESQFVPHITIAKVRYGQKFKIKKSAYEGLDDLLGSIKLPVQEIDLLSMSSSDSFGYYESFMKVLICPQKKQLIPNVPPPPDDVSLALHLNRDELS